jgi:hypothetical protein
MFAVGAVMSVWITITDVSIAMVVQVAVQNRPSLAFIDGCTLHWSHRNVAHQSLGGLERSSSQG